MTIRFPKRDIPRPVLVNRATRRDTRARFVGAIRRFPFFWELLYRIDDDFYGLEDFDFSRTPMWWGVILVFNKWEYHKRRYRLLCVGPLFRPKHFPDLMLPVCGSQGSAIGRFPNQPDYCYNSTGMRIIWERDATPLEDPNPL